MICAADTDLLDWLAEYLAVREIAPTTAVTYRSACNSIIKWLGYRPSLATTSEALNRFLAWRSTIGSKQTARCYRTALLAILRGAEESGKVALPSAIRTVTPPAHRPQGFTLDEVRRLLLYADSIQAATIRLVYDTGLRRGDVFRVRWPQVGQDGILRLVMGKNGRRHALYIPDAVLEACRRVRAIDDDRLVPYPYTMSAWAKSWARLGVRSGVNVTDRGLQALRRVAASLVARDYGDVEAARLLGHADGSGLAVFRRFYRVGEIVDRPPPSPPPLS